MSSKRGNYYKAKTKKWLEAQGFVVAPLERYRRFQKEGKTFHIKQDLLGADGLAIRADHDVVFWNSKIGRDGIKHAKDKFDEYPFPPTAHRWVICWTPRAKAPEVIDVS